MDEPTPIRILELWPSLTEEEQASLVDTVERLTAPRRLRKLSQREIAAVAESRLDFKQGRVLDDAAYEKASQEFMDGLRQKSRVRR